MFCGPVTSGMNGEDLFQISIYKILGAISHCWGTYLHLPAVIFFVWKFADPFSFNITSGVIMKSSPMSFWGQCISYRWPRRSTSPTENPSNSFSELSDIFVSQNVTDTIQTMKRHFTNIYYNFASLTSASERGMWLDCFI